MTNKSATSATVFRALKVLDHLKEMTGPQSIKNISDDLDVSPTVIHRLLTTLKIEGFVFQDSQSKLYSLGSIFMEYANKILTELPFAPIIEPSLIQLRNITDETVGFYIPNGHIRLCVMEYESRQEIRRSVGVGTQHPVHTGATGRAILSFLSEKTQDEILKNRPFEERKKLRKKLDDTKEKGYAISYAEISNSVTAISAPVFDQNNHIIGALSVSGPKYRFNNEQIKVYTTELLNATKEISMTFE